MEISSPVIRLHLPQLFHNKTRKITTLKQFNRTERTQSALFAMAMQLNAFPVAHNSKFPIRNMPVKALDYSRLFWQPSECRYIYENFDCNIAIKLGETSLNTFVVDIDDLRRAVEVMNRLAAHHIRTLIVKTQERGYHIYFSCTDCAIAGGKFSYGDLKGQGGYVLFAGSVVDDNPYTLVDASELHTDTLSNLQALLTDVLGEPITLNPTRHGRNMGGDMPTATVVTQRGRQLAKYVAYLDTPTPIGNRKDKLYKNALYALATGKQLDAVEAAAHRDDLPQSEIDRTISNAERYHRTALPRVGGQSWHWHKAKRFVETYQGWSKGQQGNTERAVILALIVRAQLDANDKGLFRASIREIKQLSQKSYTPAVNSALQRLIEKGLLIRVSGSRQTGLQDSGVSQPVKGSGQVATSTAALSVSQKLTASHWQFGDAVLQDLHSRELRSHRTDVSTVYLSQHLDFIQDTRCAELLECGSLGQSALRVYGYLRANNGASSQTIVATALSMSRATVSRALKKMLGAAYQLVEYVEDEKRWYAVATTADEWAELAQREITEHGTSRYEQRKVQISKERHENLLGIYHKILKPYQKRLEWNERQELAKDPLLAEAFDLGAEVERVVSRPSGARLQSVN